MSAVASVQETLPFDFEADSHVNSNEISHLPRIYTEEARQADVELCKNYFFRWAGAYGSVRQTRRPLTFREFQTATKRLAP
ncbi:hypothetical protein [Psychromicrobium sp. YIM B11713]|uniref:hypothetical protein n=1 Tax=Psychromicrobium sp. YIM B11713 TaxID=3145233 RepID=UPI00374F967A